MHRATVIVSFVMFHNMVDAPMSTTGKTLRRLLTEEVSIPVEVAGRALGIRRSAAYAAVRSGELPHIRIGKRISIPTSVIRQMLRIEDPR